MTYKQRIISGVSWVALGRISQQIIKFVVTVLLARLLTPEAFGLVAMVAVFIGLAQLFSDVGLGAAIIQRKQIAERHLSSIFWINLALGIVVTILFAVSAPLVADFYQEPLLIPITIAIALNFGVGALNDVQNALLQRNMQFRRLSFINIGSVIISGSVAIMMALSGFGVWSLVAQLLAHTLAQVILMWITTSWKPKFLFDWSAVKELLGFSSNLLGANLINYVLRNVDNLLIGRYVDAFSLGVYQQAYSLMILPNSISTRLLATVMLTSLAQIQDEHERIRLIMLRMQRIIAFITMPIMIGLFVVADPLIPLIFGEQWSPMVLIIRILTLAGVKEAVDATAGWICQAVGRTDVQFRLAIFNGAVTLIAFFIGVQYSVTGVAIAYVVRAYLVWHASVKLPGQLINLTFMAYCRNLMPVFFVALIMGLCVWGVGQFMPGQWSTGLRLFLQIATGVIIYPLLIFGLRLRVYHDMIELFSLISNRGKKS